MHNRMFGSLIFNAMASGEPIRVYEYQSNKSFYGIIVQATKADRNRNDRWVITMDCDGKDEYIYIQTC